jgi:NADH:ubiquinone oxidoreductase subunit 3 (subunit A)
MSFWFLVPPVAFSLVMVIVLAQSALMKRAAFRGKLGPGSEAAYACGEDVKDNSFRPEYGQFFSFAFFFSIMHVVALVLATVPTGVPGYYLMSALYVIGALIGLIALLRR